jgi:small subunit ribosomal protein S20
MANIKSQIKRNRQNEKRRQLNKSVRSDMKTAVKKVESALASGEETEALIRQAQHKIDVAASKGVVHKRTAARRKSRLVKKTQATESR